MQPLPATPFDVCHKQAGRVTSQALVRYKGNDYSAPVACGHYEVWIRGYVGEVAIGCKAKVIARHTRSYDSDDMIFSPLLIELVVEHRE